MNKVINGKRYDTDTAKLIAEHENMHDADNFNWHRTGLYLKRTGEFFAYEESGRTYDRIEPLTVDEAKALAEDFLTADEYEAVFGPVPE